ncbi:MAG: retroviral-like aspartic protease family protein [Candidatus Methanospirareceae archaeon]
MGKVVEKIKVINFKDTSKSIEIEAVIDTGATMSVLPVDLIQKLGLERLDEVSVRHADNSVKRKEVYGSIILEIAGRKAVFDVLAEDEGAQPLIGQIVLERLDLVIEPSTRKVIPNPRSPETPMIEIFMATAYNSAVRSRSPKPLRASYTCKALSEIAGDGLGVIDDGSSRGPHYWRHVAAVLVFGAPL